MFARSLLRTTLPPAKTILSRKASTMPQHPVGPVRQFFRDVPVPVDAYPLIGMVVIMCGAATFMLSKHIYEDRDHLRWLPQHGGVKFQLPGSQ